MAATYQGEAVTVLRPVDPGDPAFVVDGGEQLLIRKSDGTECVVAKKDVSDGPDVVIDTIDVSDTTEAAFAPKPVFASKPVFAAPKAKAKAKATKKR